jgi:hypothetical protein
MCFLHFHHTPRLEQHPFITTQFIRSLRWHYNRVRLYLQFRGSKVHRHVDIQNYDFTCCFVWVWNGRSHWGRNVGWGCLRIEWWGEYVELRGTRYPGNGENYVMSRVMIYTPHPILCRWSNREEWDGRGEERRIQGFGGETWGKDPTWKTKA